MPHKNAALHRLALKRKSDVWPGYRSIASFHSGVYECDHVSPYTKTAGNVDADVFLMLQDWSSSRALEGEVCQDSIELGHSSAIYTNLHLKQLLERHFGLSLAQTYGTNLFPFIKNGAMNALIPRCDMVRAAQVYGLPQIEIVKPRIVVCFGAATFNALRSAWGLGRVSSVQQGIASPFELGQAKVWLQAHTGRLGQNNRNRGGVDRVNEDWRAMAEEYGASRGRGEV
jgi:hypothetical protein